MNLAFAVLGVLATVPQLPKMLVLEASGSGVNAEALQVITQSLASAARARYRSVVLRQPTCGSDCLGALLVKHDARAVIEAEVQRENAQCTVSLWVRVSQSAQRASTGPREEGIRAHQRGGCQSTELRRSAKRALERALQALPPAPIRLREDPAPAASALGASGPALKSDGWIWTHRPYDRERTMDPRTRAKSIQAIEILKRLTPKIGATVRPEMLLRLAGLYEALAEDDLLREKAESGLRRRKQALKIYLRVVQSYPRYVRVDDALLASARLLHRQSEPSKAQNFLVRLIKQYPQSGNAGAAYLSLGGFLWEQGKAQHAQKAISKALAVDRTLAGHARYGLALCARSFGDAKRARAELRTVLRRKRDDSALMFAAQSLLNQL